MIAAVSKLNNIELGHQVGWLRRVLKCEVCRAHVDSQGRRREKFRRRNTHVMSDIGGVGGEFYVTSCWDCVPYMWNRRVGRDAALKKTVGVECIPCVLHSLRLCALGEAGKLVCRLEFCLFVERSPKQARFLVFGHDGKNGNLCFLIKKTHLAPCNVRRW